jgi:1-acyl-sn-glycerol-3-phosphate acyltransferase
MTPDSPWLLVPIAILLWVAAWMWAIPSAVAAIRNALTRRIGDSWQAGLLDLVSGWYCRWIHGLTFVGFDDLPAPFRHGETGGGIVVANHASGTDPLFVQAGVRRFVRWMMWADMMEPRLSLVWETARILPVRYGVEDATTVRQAVRWVRDGNLLGVFAEGGIARPPGEVRPFQPGVGLIARLTKAPVLLLHIDGAPYTDSAFGALVKPSRTTVSVVGVFELSNEKDPAEATARLREAMIAHSGWPTNDESIVTRWLDEQPNS